MQLQPFLALLAMCLVAAVAAVNLRHLIWGELFGLLSILAGFAALVGYCFTWPLTPTGGVALAFLVFGASVLVGWFHYALSDERAKDKIRTAPNFEIEIHEVRLAPYPAPSQAVRVSVQLTLHNHGADSAARNWSPIFEHLDGHRSFFADAILRAIPTGPDGAANIVLNTATIPRHSRQSGWLLFDVHESQPLKPNEIYSRWCRSTGRKALSISYAAR